MRKLETIKGEIKAQSNKLKEIKEKRDPILERIKKLQKEKRRILRETLIGGYFKIRRSIGEGKYEELYVKVNDRSESDNHNLKASIFKKFHYANGERYQIEMDTEIEQLELDGLGNHEKMTKDEFYEVLREFLMKVNVGFSDEAGGILPM